MPSRPTLLGALLLLTALPHPAQSQAHHDHGEAATVGSVRFASHCRAPAKPTLERGVALLHSFWYEEAATTFGETIQADSACSLAWWGLAMSHLHPLWTPPPPAEIQAGMAASDAAVRLSRRGSREHDYAEAIQTFYRAMQTGGFRAGILAWESAMAGVQKRNPGDDEARIFHGLSLIAVGQQEPGDTTYRHQREAAALLEPLIARYPDHPGLAHYLIHAFDSPGLAQLARRAADQYARIAPDVPHALHMPSHIYTRLGLWSEALASNQRSAAAAQRMEASQGWDGVWGQRLHAWDYLAYASLQLGQDSIARDLARQAAEVTKTIPPDDLVSEYALAAIPARCALERDDWAAAAALKVRPAPGWRATEGLTWFARAIGAARSGHADLAQIDIDSLRILGAALANAGGPQSYWADQVKNQRIAAAAWVALAQGDTATALSEAREAAATEDRTEKHPVTPGPLLPARELYADLLLAVNRPAEALENYRAVEARQPHRARTARGIASATARLSRR